MFEHVWDCLPVWHACEECGGEANTVHCRGQRAWKAGRDLWSLFGGGGACLRLSERGVLWPARSAQGHMGGLARVGWG